MQQPLIAFRTDAAVHIGLGHLRRCRSLAAELQRLGARTRFLMRRHDFDPFRVGGNFTPTWLPMIAVNPEARPAGLANAAWLCGDLLADAEAFCSCLDERVAAVVVDHYGIDAGWHEYVAQRLRCPVVAIDDLGDRALSVDLIVDHNDAADHGAKYRAANLRGCPVLGGPTFALLDRGFSSAPRNQANHPVRSIGIFMGGADAAGWSLTAHRALRELVCFDGAIEIATTSANPLLGALRALAAQEPSTRLLVDAHDLVEFFGRHELHIGAGGGATWERCCLGAPTLAVIAAPNQREVLLPLAGVGVLEVIDDNRADAATIARRTLELLDRPQYRKSMSKQAMTLVDGHGSTRVATRILNLCKP
jgi:UDP-2,4-diacetamido-2,4,6-trideoxy-beta-L-altropyranose hydrolase